MFILLSPLTFIIFSFIAIFTSVFKISDIQARYKTLSTCTPQLFIVFLYYVPRYVVYTFDLTAAFTPDLRIMLTMWYNLLPPVISPMIYCFRTKEIKDALRRKTRQRKVSMQMTMLLGRAQNISVLHSLHYTHSKNGTKSVTVTVPFQTVHLCNLFYPKI